MANGTTYDAIKYAARKQAGLCTRCGVKPLAEGKSCCPECLERRRNGARKVYSSRQAHKGSIERYKPKETSLGGVSRLKAKSLGECFVNPIIWRQIPEPGEIKVDRVGELWQA